MAIFGKRKTGEDNRALVGVEIGTTSVKVVELSSAGKAALGTFGLAQLSATALDTSGAKLVEANLGGWGIDTPEIIDIVRGTLSEAGVKAKQAVFSLASAEVFHALISVAESPKNKELFEAVVSAQAAKIFPLPPSEMVIDTTVITETEPAEAGNFAKVLLIAAPKTLIEKIVQLAAGLGLDLAAIETEVMALVRSIVGVDTSRVMVVDIGGARSTVMIVDRQVPYLVRTIKSGGAAMTKVIASTSGVSLGEAEAMKKDLSFSPGSQSLPPAVIEAVKPILHEIKYSLQLYADQDFHSNKTVDKILLTGGGALIGGLVDYITQNTGINTYLADPWGRVMVPKDSQMLTAEVGPRLAVAIGLALRLVGK